MLYSVEKIHFPTDWPRVQHLKQHLVNMEDIQNFEEPEEMLQHHMIKYGMEKSIVPMKITEMESLPKPKKADYKTIVNNLNKIIANVNYITDNGEVERLERSVVKAIIEQAFHDELVHQHNKALLKFKKDRKCDVLASEAANVNELNYGVYYDSSKMLGLA